MTTAGRKTWAPKPTPETVAAVNELFNTAMFNNNLKNDAQLCKLLDLEPCVISRMRHGHVRLSAETVIRLYQKAGLSMEQLLAAREGQV